MTRLEAALVEAVGIFEDLKIPYMLIGGLAVAQWGEPRATLDLDFTVWVEPQNLERMVRELASRLVSRSGDPVEFVQRTRVLPGQTLSGVSVDIIFAMWPIEQQAIAAAANRSIGGVEVRVASVEYLLFLKLTSERPKDLDDAAALMRRHRQAINHGWLEEQLSDIAEALDQPGILDRYRRIRDQDRSSEH